MESTVDESSIKKFYEGADVFITGGSGYIGKILVEKLLRSCPDVKTIYLLLRINEGTSAAQRVHDLTDNLMYNKLKAENPRALEKIKVIEGDAKKLNLGISDADVEKLKSCSVVFHSAASVRFDDPLKDAILLNTRGTREACKLAQLMPNLKAFVHVSTAYVQPSILHIEEKIYPANVNWQSYIKFAENLDDDYINLLSDKLTDFSPNTYVFTKHMAEHVCVDFKQEFGLPVAIVRPSIVSASESEPMIGFSDNINGPMGLVMVGAIGLNHVMNTAGHNIMNMIPIDICVKALIAASFKVWKDRVATMQDADVPVYNAASVKFVSYTSMQLAYAIARKNPSMKCLGIPYVTFTECWYYAWLVRILRNLLPALILDGLLYVSGNKPKLLKIHRIIYNAESAVRYFTIRKYIIDNIRFNDLNLAISDSEKQDFGVHERFSNGNANLYKEAYIVGLKTILKESPDDLPKARQRYFYVALIQRTVNSIVIFAAFMLLYRIVLNICK